MSPTGREKALDTLLQIRISTKLKKALERLAQEARRDLSEFVRLALEDIVEKPKKR